MKLSKSFLIPALFLLSSFALAEAKEPSTLEIKRQTVIQEYFHDLQKADPQAMSQLFEENAYVISTSKGKLNAKDFFYAFLPTVVQFNTEQHQAFLKGEDPDHSLVRFHLNFVLNNGDRHEGEYVDEFIFTKNSDKLAAVYMFENLKFPIN